MLKFERLGFVLMVTASAGILSCSDAVPSAAKGAVRMDLARIPGATKLCSSDSQTKALPKAVEAPSDSNKGTAVVDGDQGAVIACAVKGDAKGPFTVNARFSMAKTTFTLANATIPTQGEGKGTIDAFVPEWGSMTHVTDKPCTIEVKEVKAGGVWAKFSCSPLLDEDRGECALSGFFYFDTCES